MKIRNKGLLLMLVVLCAVVFGIYCINTQNRQDQTAPVISMDAPEIELSVQDDRDACLRGVSAWDNEDGDVTEFLVVEGMSAIGRNDCVTVTYAAFDGAGNVSKAQRTIHYTDYEGPKFVLEHPLIFINVYTIDLLNYVTAFDPMDGDISERIKATLSGGEGDLSQEGIHMVNLRVSNSMGDTARITVPVEINTQSDYNAVVWLTDYLIYLKTGDAFNPHDYLECLYAGYKEIPPNELTDEQIIIQSDVDTKAPGTYSVTYTVSDGNYTGFTRLIVVVEE